MSFLSVNLLSSRPIASFHPDHWAHQLQHFTPYDEASRSKTEKEIKQLQDAVDKLLKNKDTPTDKLNLVDTLERLGVAYHFEEEIDEFIQQLYTNHDNTTDQDDLYHSSVRFRILRQHGFPVPCDVFNKFKDENGSFQESLTKDVRGILSLYEACHVRVQGDDILEDALQFTTSCLKETIPNNLASSLAEEVAHALNQPLHKGMPRLECRHYISVYEKDPSHNKMLLQFAKLDFNHLQSSHRQELQEFARWWKDLHLKVQFSRDRLAAAYFWILGTYYEPKYMPSRKLFRKFFKTTQLLDDTYDAYGTIDELEQLTEAFQRWDKSYADKLPEHVKWTFKAVLEAFDEVEEELAKTGRSFCIDYAKQQMKVLSQAYLQEAKWCHQKYVPTYDEYMKVALITSPYPFGVVTCFLSMENATKEAFEWACQSPMPEATTAIATIIRLLNDMYGHKFEQSRNHVASAVQCYMARHEIKEEEQVQEELVKKVEKAWKDVNKAMLQPYVIPKPLLIRILNLARSADVIYKGEDGYTMPSQTMKNNVSAVLFDPIPI